MKKPRWSAARIAKIWTDIALVLCCLAILALGCWLAISPWVFDRGDLPKEVVVFVAIGDQSFLPHLPLAVAAGQAGDGLEVSNPRLVHGSGELRIDTDRWWPHFLSMGRFLVGLLVALYICWSLRGLLKTVLQGRPFTAENGRRIRNLGLVILISGLVWPLVEYVSARAVLALVTFEGMSLSPAIGGSKDVVLTGLLLLVLSTIFRHGTELEEERSLTV